MKWYEKKFSDFFNKWKKGDLFLKEGIGFFGEVEDLEFAERFEDSTIRFVCYDQSGEEKHIPFKEIRHFHANNGPILNIGKYVNIVKLEETSYLSVIDGGKTGGPIESDGKAEKPTMVRLETSDEMSEGGEKIICIAFGLEFYTTEKMAKTLQRDIKKILFTKLEGVPVLSIDDRAPVDLTPTFSKWYIKSLGRLWHKPAKHARRRSAFSRSLVSIEKTNDAEKEVKS